MSCEALRQWAGAGRATAADAGERKLRTTRDVKNGVDGLNRVSSGSHRSMRPSGNDTRAEAILAEKSASRSALLDQIASPVSTTSSFVS